VRLVQQLVEAFHLRSDSVMVEFVKIGTSTALAKDTGARNVEMSPSLKQRFNLLLEGALCLRARCWSRRSM
jgi:hypothetical protein